MKSEKWYKFIFCLFSVETRSYGHKTEDVLKETTNENNVSNKYFVLIGQLWCMSTRRVWRYQRGNQNLYIEVIPFGIRSQSCFLILPEPELFSDIAWGRQYQKTTLVSNPKKGLYIKEEQTTQWPKEKVQKDKQRSTKHTHKIKIVLESFMIVRPGLLYHVYNSIGNYLTHI